MGAGGRGRAEGTCGHSRRGGTGSRSDINSGLVDELGGEPAGVLTPFQERLLRRESICGEHLNTGPQVGKKEGVGEAGSPWVGTEGHGSGAAPCREEPDGAGSAVTHETVPCH